MYPFVTLWGQHIEMTGLGVIMGILIFCLITFFYAKRMNLVYDHLFDSLPTFVLLIYFFGSYTASVLNTGHFIPYSIVELGQIIVPRNFGFYAGGLSIGITISTLIFLYKLPSKIMRQKWIDVLFLGYSLATIIVGIFFVLGDNMIGIPTISSLGVSALTPFSEVSKFTSVYPVGLFLSISSLISYLITIIVFKRQVDEGWGFGGFAVYFFLIAITLIFQNYSRHGVISIGTISLDLNQYILVLLSAIYGLGYAYLYKKKNR